MNKRRLEKLKLTAYRTIAILELIEENKTVKEIAERTGGTRQLIEYYIKLIKSAPAEKRK